MIRFQVRQFKNDLSTSNGRWFAYPHVEETVDLDGLAEHMSKHNTVFSKGVVKGLLTDMVNCVKEIMLEGKNVKIDDLAIFSVGIKNAKGGAASEETFTTAGNIDGVKFRARATGELRSKNLDLEAVLRRVVAIDASGSNPNAGDVNP